MAALWKVYPAEVVARQAVEALTAAGVPGRDIRLLTGSRLHDVRHEPAGSFCGSVDPDAPVGKFAGPPRPRWVGGGTFVGDARSQRQGSFADAERDLIESHERGGGHVHASGDAGVRRLLQSFAVGGMTAEDVVAALHAGRAVVVVEVSEIPPREAAARLDDLAPVA
jgi:hypothetical protein